MARHNKQVKDGWGVRSRIATLVKTMMVWGTCARHDLSVLITKGVKWKYAHAVIHDSKRSIKSLN